MQTDSNSKIDWRKAADALVKKGQRTIKAPEPGAFLPPRPSWEQTCKYQSYRNTDLAKLPPQTQKALPGILSWEYGPRGLLLNGPTGTGKTRCAWLLIKKLWEAGISIAAFDCADFGHRCIRYFRDGEAEEWLGRMAKHPLIFFDDFGKMPFTERVEAELFTLIERRMAHSLPCIYTMNMTSDDLMGKASEDRGRPLVRRLRESCRVVTLR